MNGKGRAFSFFVVHVLLINLSFFVVKQEVIIMTTQQTNEKKLKEMLEKQASILGMNLDYKPDVIMENINEAPLSAWHDSRRSGWGGSDEAVLNGLSKYTSLTEVSMSKVLGISKPVDSEKQHIFDFGHANEWLILKTYADLNGYKFLTYSKYFVVLKTDEDVRSRYPMLSLSGTEGVDLVFTKSFSNLDEAESLCNELQKEYPNTHVEAEETNDPKDIRDITAEDHQKYDSQGIVCVDRRQYRHPLYPSMIGDCDGLAITPSGEKIGIECKTYSFQRQGTFTSGVYGNEGVKLKNPEYALQVAHYMAVLNINRFDIVTMCGNLMADINVITVLRDLQLEKELCENCEKAWAMIQRDEIPDETKLTNEMFSSILSVTPKIENVSKPVYIDDEDLVLEIRALDDLSKAKQKEREVIDEEINQKKMKLLDKMKSGENYYERVYVKKDDGTYEVAINSSKLMKLDEKRLKANCPEVYAEYAKCKTFNSYLESQLPDVKREYMKCVETQPSLKIKKARMA